MLAAGVLAGSTTGLLAALVASRIGRRPALVLIGLLMTVSGLLTALGGGFAAFILAGATGMLGVAGMDLGPFLAVEQAVLAQTASTETRNRAFARYSFSGAAALAVGGVAAGAAGRFAIPTEGFFLLFALLGLVTAAAPALLSADVEGERNAPVFGSLRPVLGLSGLFSLDSLGSGLVANAVLVYWLHVRFGASPAVLGPAFGLMSVLTAFSLELAGRLADRIGLVNTMVFTHLPASLALLAVPFLPSLGWALAVLVFRAAIQSMDVPARQAYIVSIVKPSERSGALAVTGAVRGVAQSMGPVITGAAIQAAALGLPFLLGGALKSTYDLSLYAGFRRRFGEHEPARR